ncbi:flagellar hook-associated protein FlgK [Vibrio parahaemolyticus]|uniref:flagellar hook-associated protein FlgK n=1 Tax=Vibrio parahaemolyticus TaxID=670 RepID=UPI000B788BB4|nr:flagellar hook-associated protein FlgK [Vibrio parahaemolyticus]EGQ8133695.1 flagellar hook-associated protein FlgK [Vibrio parahaemolyticus]EGQ8147613.1 flagellar hook-associated protein FlgK [Vibrio parahaemolyticus]EGQ8250189.1 flagellar hook-associated protein FlgK [Vibrio parahaemolyticus]EGQ8263024.1 flagellar hook-associated protein FlgK [Vibrio parahaemolyticus]EGQ8268379.1 flagellar hook-associated protein FlgK [Vibrio parahaemolyticus]
MNLVNIALSGLNANRVALDVTAQNVASVNTPGYSRQQALMATVGDGKSNRLSSGMGVEVTSIRRVTDQFLVKQTWSTNSLAAYAAGYTSNMSQLENTLGADGFSISAGLDSLNAALNDATVKPESMPYRQQIINESEALARRFNTLTQSLHNQHKDMNDQRTAALTHANSLMSNIAHVNKQIVEMQGTGGNPAQLMDTREKLIGELSQVIEVKTTDQPDGSMQVTLVSGQPLVMGSDFGQLSAIPDPSDPYLADLHVNFANQSFAIGDSVGGKLGAINDYQTDVLKPNQVALDDMAKALADEYNAVLATGKDLKGNAGKPLFNYDPDNPAASLTITDLSAEELAFSSDGTPGNANVLKSLIDLSNKPVAVTGYGSVSLNDAFTSMVGQTAIKARQADADYQAKLAMSKQAHTARDNVSAVNSDEEAANLMTFANAHNANMKVISTANQLFDSVLQLF